MLQRDVLARSDSGGQGTEQTGDLTAAATGVRAGDADPDGRLEAVLALAFAQPGAYTDWFDKSKVEMKTSGAIEVPAHGYRVLVR